MQEKAVWMSPERFEIQWKGRTLRNACFRFQARRLEHAFKRIYVRLNQSAVREEPMPDAAVWIFENKHRILRDLMTFAQECKNAPRLSQAVFGRQRRFRIGDAAQMALDMHAQNLGSEQIKAAFHKIIRKGLLSQEELWFLQTALRFRLLTQIAQQAKALLSGASVQTALISGPIQMLYALETVDWEKALLALNPIHQLFCTETVYQNSDAVTQHQICQAAATLARRAKRAQIAVAESALDQAKRMNCDLSYCLLGTGRNAVLQALGARNIRPRQRNALGYMCTVYALTLIGSFILWRFFGPVSLWMRIQIWGVVILLANRLYSFLFRPKRLPRLDFDKGIAPQCRTMTAVVRLVTQIQDVQDIARQLEDLYLSNRGSGLCFAAVTDFSDAHQSVLKEDETLLTALTEQITALNARYRTDVFCAFHRPRTLTPEGLYQGWERKRGAVMTLARLLDGKDEAYLLRLCPKDYLQVPFRYLIVLDADTRPYPQSLSKLVGILAHPAQSRYAIVAARTATSIETVRTRFQRLLCQDAGLASYRGVCTSLYQDMAGEGIFCGKGILDIRKYLRALDGNIPEQRVLSHDLLEGLYAKCAFASDLLFFDALPSTPSAYFKRQERWIRGDFQLIPWLFKRNFSGLDRWKIADNLRRWLTAPATLAALLFFCATGSWSAALTTVLLYLILLPQNCRIFGLILLPYESFVNAAAACRAVWRLAITKRALLAWTTAAQSEGLSAKNKLLQRCGVLCAILSILLAIPLRTGLYFAIPAALLWCLGGLYSKGLGQALQKRQVLEKNQQDTLLELSRRIYLWFESVIDARHHYLPPDNEQIYPAKAPAARTSPTNIGFSLCAHAAAYSLGFISRETLLQRLTRTFDALCKLESWNGHLYNWYDTQTLYPLEPRYVSTVDCGNLCASLLLCAQALENASFDGRSWDRTSALQQLISLAVADGILTQAQARQIEVGKFPEQRDLGAYCAAFEPYDPPISATSEPKAFLDLAVRMRHYVAKSDFSLLYDRRRKLFFIGYDAVAGHFGNAHYDLLASEARLMSYLAIAKGDVPPAHFEALGRPAVRAAGKPVLLSWSGTLFEYLMPPLFLEEPFSGIAQCASISAICLQKKRSAFRLWGKSESGYYRFDGLQNYQYQAFGLKDLSVQGDLSEKNVFAPYAVLLALPILPQNSMAELDVMRQAGLFGRFGPYEAADVNEAGIHIVASHMAHHQAMALMAIEQVLAGALRKQFMQVPVIRAWSLLLDERLPKKLPKRPRLSGAASVPVRRLWEKQTLWADQKHLECVPIGNERAGMILCGAQNCLSIGNIRLNKFVGVPEGIRIAIRGSGVQLEPCRQGHYQYNAHWILYHQSGEKADASARFYVDSRHEMLEIAVTVNAKTGCGPLRVDLYWEPLLCPENQDGVHPAFQDLFLRLQRHENGVLVRRKGRGQKDVFAYAASNGSDRLVCALDRAVYVGRGGRSRYDGYRDVPQGVQPCVALCAWLENPGKEKREILFHIGLAENENQAKQRIRQCEKIPVPIEKAIADDAVLRAGARLCALVAMGGPATAVPCESPGSLRDLLWRFGVSGDHPYLLLLAGSNGVFLRELPGLLQVLCNNAIHLDLIVVTTGSSDYMQRTRRTLEAQIQQGDVGALFAGQTCLRFIARETLDDASLDLLRAGASTVLEDGRSLLIQIEEQTRIHFKMEKRTKLLPEQTEAEEAPEGQRQLLSMGYGGFLSSGAYQIALQKDEITPMPYTYLMANASFGALVTESGGGYTWALNSAENKLTPWYNDPVRDLSGENVRFRAGDEPWRPLYSGARCVTYGGACAVYRLNHQGLDFLIHVFVDKEQPEKRVVVQVENQNHDPVSIELQVKVRWLLGSKADLALRSVRIAGESAGVRAQNIRTPGPWAYLGAIGTKPNAVFPSPDAPCAVYRVPCGALAWQMELQPQQQVLLGWRIGCAEQPDLTHPIATEAAWKALEKTSATWDCFLSQVQIETPDTALNLLVNHWLPYQVLACRMLARTAYYQAGGAYGFRDQLQDAISLLLYDARIAREQILRCCAHQFTEGDVQHWWHEPRMGVRTRISDDLLFLPWAVCQYVQATGDDALLSEQVPFLKGEEIPPDKEDLFFTPEPSQETGSVLEHCLRAVRRASRFGRHGLVLIGTGDWNDAFNAVGKMGQGESVFTTQLLHRVLIDLAALMERIGQEQRAQDFRQNALRLADALEQHAWDGRWYRRAYFDDGAPMGSQSSPEGQIDLISQSWAVLSGAADPKRAKMAVEYAYRFLFDRTHQTVRLMTPPYTGAAPSPGYIADYPPGVRENGGQYTHGAVWFFKALCQIGDFERAMEILHALLPTTHSATRKEAQSYGVEPYVLAADVYDGDYLGRGGWTWYTGAAGWMLSTVLTDLLGVTQSHGTVAVCPPEGLDFSAYSVSVRGEKWVCKKGEIGWQVVRESVPPKS